MNVFIKKRYGFVKLFNLVSDVHYLSHQVSESYRLSLISIL